MVVLSMLRAVMFSLEAMLILIPQTDVNLLAQIRPIKHAVSGVIQRVLNPQNTHHIYYKDNLNVANEYLNYYLYNLPDTEVDLDKKITKLIDELNMILFAIEVNREQASFENLRPDQMEPLVFKDFGLSSSDDNSEFDFEYGPGDDL